MARGLLGLHFMNLRRFGVPSAVAVACLAANVALAEPAARSQLASTGSASHAAPVASAKPGTVRVSAVTIPPSASEHTRAMVREAVERRLSEIAPDATRGTYSASVALLQLRRYIGPDGDEPQTVCIVDLALHDASGVLVGSVRGRATAASASPQDALDAAARGAASRVPEALQMVARVAGQSLSKAPGAYARR
jgi:hypothetical protein